MRGNENPDEERDYLKRLPPEYYRGTAIVHWTMTVQQRQTGWLTPVFHAQFREVLTHAMFRYGLCSLVYCCMPNHFHLLWQGLFRGSDQRNAMKYFRKHVNGLLERSGTRLQKQPYDHVLQDKERGRSALEETVNYIANNPVRAGLVREGHYHEYPYTGCLVPGYPELSLWEKGHWPRFWRICEHLRREGLTKV